MKKSFEETIVMKVTIRTIIANIILSLFKLIAGLLSKSYGMISDAFHSISDVMSTLIVMIGFRLASKDRDEKHPYGHERFECVASIILAIILIGTGLLIGYGGLQRIISNNYPSAFMFTQIALIAAIASIIIKEIMFWYTIVNAKKINSGSLKADAWHHRTDAISSVGSMVGIIAIMLGYPIIDSLTSLLICILIVKVGIDIFIDGIKKMIDESCEKDLEMKIKEYILQFSYVEQVKQLKTRKFGNKIYVEVEIYIYANISLYDCHLITTNIHDSIEQSFPIIKHCLIIPYPYLENSR